MLNKYYIRKKCFKYFICYTSHSDDGLKPLHIKIPKSWFNEKLRRSRVFVIYA